MEAWDWRARLGYGARQAVGLGMVAGVGEVVVVLTGLQLPMIGAEVLLLGAVSMIGMAIVGGIAGLLAGVVVQPLCAHEESSRAIGRQLGGAAGLLAAFYLIPAALTLFADGQVPGGLAMLAMPVGFAGVTFYNARYWLRRVEVDRAPLVGWLPLSAGLSLLVLVAAAASYAGRETGGTRASLERRNIVFVTVDGLRPDDRLPAVTAIGTEGIRFLDAVSPSPHTTPSAASMLTGLHPLRHQVLVDGDSLGRAYPTLPEGLAARGYATAAFVSSRAVGHATGLSQGFAVYDDDWMPIVGLDRLAAIAPFAPRLAPETRASADTAERFLTWLEENHERAFFAWVHLADPNADEVLVKVRAALQHHEVLDQTLLVVTGTHGEMRGEHGATGARTLYDPAIRVPLVIRAPGVKLVAPLVEAQVRLMDLPATVHEWLGIESPGETEGVGLLAYGRGQREATMWLALVGQGLDGRLEIGMRNNGVKYVRAADGSERLHDVREDPTEAINLAEDHAETLEQARSLLASEMAAFLRLTGK